jgi:hypothetical protein
MLNTTISMGLFGLGCTCVEREDHFADVCERCMALSEYSDLYKEAYGIRPRYNFRDWSMADIQEAIESLPRYSAEQEAREREAARLRMMPLSGAGWSVDFAGQPEEARDRYMDHVGVSPEWLY